MKQGLISLIDTSIKIMKHYTIFTCFASRYHSGGRKAVGYSYNDLYRVIALVERINKARFLQLIYNYNILAQINYCVADWEKTIRSVRHFELCS